MHDSDEDIHGLSSMVTTNLRFGKTRLWKYCIKILPYSSFNLTVRLLITGHAPPPTLRVGARLEYMNEVVKLIKMSISSCRFLNLLVLSIFVN